jgi:toxin ParE1/3/4
MPRLFITPRAILDLIEIWNYIADESEECADISIDKLNEAMEKLRRNPGVRGQRNELAHMRSFPFQRYVIFYRGDSSGVEVVRVLHGARGVQSSFERKCPDADPELASPVGHAHGFR